jgi:hypothetical protein
MLHHANRATGGNAGDPYFNNVSLLLKGNGVNGAQNNTFVDSSPNNLTITRNGNTRQGTFSPFGNYWSYTFDNSADYVDISSSSSNLSMTGDYTIEFWFYADSNDDVCIFDSRPNSTNGRYPAVFVNPDDGYMSYFINNAGLLVYGGDVLSQWIHCAIVRNGSTITMYINGTAVDTATDSNTYTIPAARLRMGANGGFYSTSNDQYYGYISNFRIVNGTAVYTSNFTPPSNPLTAISGTYLLTAQSNGFKDNSSNALSFSPTGNVGASKFNPLLPYYPYVPSLFGGSAYFDGTGDYLSIADTTLLEVPTQDFTMEAWIYLLSLPASGSGSNFLQKGILASNNLEYILGVDTASGNTRLSFDASTSGTDITDVFTATSGNIEIGMWYHCAVTRTGTSLKLWLNGVEVGSFNTYPSSTFTGNGTSTIGANPAGDFGINGYLTNLRVVKGTAVYTSTFTPTTSPLTAITNTNLLCNFVDAGIRDYSQINYIDTVGNAQVSTSVKKFDLGSFAFDGTGDWLFVPNDLEQQLSTGEFTIESWVYLSATGAAQGIIGKGTSTTGWLLSVNSTNKVVFSYGSSTITSTGSLSGSTWYHVAVVREGTGTNQTKIYINGVNDGTGTVTTNFTQTNGMYIGASRTGTTPLTGYLEDVRITKGIARYTSTFTPPTLPLPTF